MEKRKFVLERRVPVEMRNQIPPPVKTVIGEDGRQVEVRVPEESDRYVQYRDGYLPVLFVSKLDRRMFHVLWEMDGHRIGKNRFKYEMAERERAREQMVERRQAAVFEQAAEEGYDKMRYRESRNPGYTQWA